jgi:hypothetical protein
MIDDDDALKWVLVAVALAVALVVVNTILNAK